MNRPFGVPALAGPNRLKAGLQTSGVPRNGSWPQCTASKSWGLSINHDRASNRSLPWESGAEDARTPNADASSADSAGAKRLECVRFILILTQKNPCWTCIVNPLDLLDFQGFDGRGRPTGLPAKPATRLFTGLLDGFGCLAHVLLGKDERFIGAFRPARDGQRFMVNARSQGRGGFPRTWW